MRPGAPQNRRILVVDDDRAIAEELRGSLRVAGFDAEAVSLAAGLTPEFILRLAPGLVLLDAAAGGFRAETVRAIVLGLRARLGCRLLLMGEPGPALASRARELGADGAVDKSSLLRDPRGTLGAEDGMRAIASQGPERTPRPQALADRTPGPGALRPPHGDGAQGAPPPLPRPAPPAAPAPAIVAMIEEELARLEPGEEGKEPTFHVVVDLFSENNFYVSKTPTGRLVGIFVATDLPPKVGTLVRLTVVLLGGHRIVTRGEVAWNRGRSTFSSKLPAGAGVRMLDLGPEDKEQIRRFLTQRAPYGYTGA